MKLELIFFNNAILLEGPCWDAKNNLLYFVSIRQNTIFSLDPDSGVINSYCTDGAVGCAVINADGNILEAEKNGIYTINSQTKEKTWYAHIITDSKMRYNDGKLDPAGRLLVGTMGDLERAPGEGGLYSVEKGSSKLLIGSTTVANGLGFNLAEDTLYFIDTPTKQVRAYDYDIKTGNVSNERIVVKLTETGSPDGMCVDIDDMIWVAEWGGGRICKWNPKTGERICEIELPATNVTSACIGGKNMDYLFITTAKCNEIDEPLAGGLFRVKIR